jgi:cardiolipin synthase
VKVRKSGAIAQTSTFFSLRKSGFGSKTIVVVDSCRGEYGLCTSESARMTYSPDEIIPAILRVFVTAFRQFRAAPNLLTMLRLFVLPFLVITILAGHWRLAFALLWIAGVSDGLDGLLARKLAQHTKLGQYLDPIADKLLLSTMFVVLTHVGAIPRYVTVLVLSRDVGILLISTLLFATNTLRNFLPSKLGKLNTVVQILGVLTVMTCEVLPRAGLQDLRTVLLWAIAVLAPVSAAEYAWIVIRRVSEPIPTVAPPRG